MKRRIVYSEYLQCVPCIEATITKLRELYLSRNETPPKSKSRDGFNILMKWPQLIEDHLNKKIVHWKFMGDVAHIELKDIRFYLRLYGKNTNFKKLLKDNNE